MNAEIFAALAQLEKERGIPQAYMIEKITQALVAAYKKDKEGYTDNVVVDIKDGNIEIYPAMGLSLTYDHRAVDGTPAARFQKELGKNLENFTTLLAK